MALTASQLLSVRGPLIPQREARGAGLGVRRLRLKSTSSSMSARTYCTLWSRSQEHSRPDYQGHVTVGQRGKPRCLRFPRPMGWREQNLQVTVSPRCVRRCRSRTWAVGSVSGAGLDGSTGRVTLSRARNSQRFSGKEACRVGGRNACREYFPVTEGQLLCPLTSMAPGPPPLSYSPWRVLSALTTDTPDRACGRERSLRPPHVDVLSDPLWSGSYAHSGVETGTIICIEVGKHFLCRVQMPLPL